MALSVSRKRGFGLVIPPCIAEIQLAAFAHEIETYETVEEYNGREGDEEVKWASQSFVPAGLFQPGGDKTDPPQALALFTGHVVESGIRLNDLTGNSFYWALVETLGLTCDVVVDRAMLAEPPAAGCVLSGMFWLSGQIKWFR